MSVIQFINDFFYDVLFMLLVFIYVGLCTTRIPYHMVFESFNSKATTTANWTRIWV